MLWSTAVEEVGHGDYELAIFFPKMDGSLKDLLLELRQPFPPPAIKR